MEEWRKCFFDPCYYVSNVGRIKRKLHNGEERIIKGSILNKNKSHPYYYIQLQRDGKRKNYLIHRVVATAFIPNDNENYKYIDHIDRNTMNNTVENLRWADQKLNMSNCIHYRNDITGTDKERANKMSREYYKKDPEKKIGKMTCECGRVISKCNRWAHYKSDIHKKLMNSKTPCGYDN
tara:strand:+ start:115 stop:651 length:537 start_codon:yes stop_codon:yes gene_type:complete